MNAADVMQAYLAAVRAGDFDAAFARFAEDVVFRIRGRSRFAGEHRGRTAALAHIHTARAASRGHDVSVEVVDALMGAA